jgi:hypothetical protein
VRKEVCFALFLSLLECAASIFSSLASLAQQFSHHTRAMGDTTPAISHHRSKELPKCLCNAPNNLHAHLRQQAEKFILTP